MLPDGAEPCWSSGAQDALPAESLYRSVPTLLHYDRPEARANPGWRRSVCWSIVSDGRQTVTDHRRARPSGSDVVWLLIVVGCAVLFVRGAWAAVPKFLGGELGGWRAVGTVVSLAVLPWLAVDAWRRSVWGTGDPEG